MRRILLLPLGGAAALVLAAACTDSPDSSPQPSGLTGPNFAAQPKPCDARALSKAARNFFPKEFDRQAQVLIGLVEDACAADPGGFATDEAFDVMALMETALGGGSGLDAAAGTALATGLVPFLSLTGCESSGCVAAGFDADVALALAARGAFAVRGGAGDPAGPIVSRDAVTPQTQSDPAVWGLSPSTDWNTVLGGRALVYGYPSSLAGAVACDPATADCPATDEEYVWQTLPDVAQFGAQMIVASCLVIDDAVVPESFLRIRRNTTALEKPAFDACAAFLPATAARASFLEAALAFLSPLPRHLAAGVKKTGPGGNASDFSRFTALGATSEATLEIAPLADGTVDQPIGPVFVTARTANGTPLERVQVEIRPETNNGSWNVSFLPPGPADTEACAASDPGTTCRYTAEEDGTAGFEGLTLDKTGGYRICASVKPLGDLGFSFPEKVCSNGINVRPN